MVGNTPKLTSPTKNVTGSSVSVSGDVLYIPLEFWFARNPGLASYIINAGAEKHHSHCKDVYNEKNHFSGASYNPQMLVV